MNADLLISGAVFCGLVVAFCFWLPLAFFVFANISYAIHKKYPANFIAASVAWGIYLSGMAFAVGGGAVAFGLVMSLTPIGSAK